MKITLDDKFKQALPILQTLNQAHYEAYFVGGAVRDHLLGRPIHDVDITSSALPDEIKTLFKTISNYTGEKHGTVMVFLENQPFEVTTFRIDGEYSDNRHPDQVSFTKTLQEDLARRDFTINALAINEAGEVKDFFNGLDDLKKQLIRAVGDPQQRFTEDALRILRAYRFSSQLGFEIEEATRSASQKLVSHLESIAIERITVEFEKTLMGKAAGKAVERLISIGAFDYFPGHWHDLPALVNQLDQHAIKKMPLVWANVLFYTEGQTSVLRKWKLSNELIRQAETIFFGQQALAESLNPNTVFAYYDTLKDILVFDEMLEGQLNATDLQTIKENLPIQHVNDLAINGSDLINQAGLKPGPEIGETLQRLVDLVVNQQIPNEAENLLKEARHD